ncbi:MAG: caspase family protein [Cyanobacteria bacterium J06555_13]
MAFDKGHALVIGVGSYQDAPELNVPLTVKDAQAVVEILQNPARCGYASDHVRYLHDQTATRQNIEKVLDDLASSLQETDTLFIFYSGHGDYGEDGYYLTTHDTRLQGKKVVQGSGLHEKTLATKLKAIKAKRVLLIFNACHSGEISPGTLSADTGSGSNLPEKTAAALLGTGEGRVIITACREAQQSYFLQNESLTLFTRVLVQGLSGQDIPNRRGYISVFDLYEHVFTQVSSKVEQQFGKLGLVQEPELTIQKGVGVMAVALHQQMPPSDTDRPDTLGGYVREVKEKESRAALQQIMYGDVIDARGSQGLNIRPTGPVTQHFGNSTVINTGGGDYAGRDMYKSEIVGASRNESTDLQEICDQVTQQIERADVAELDDLADDLRGIELDVKAAIKAEDSGKAERRQAKLTSAQQAMKKLAEGNPQLRSLDSLLQKAR